MTTSELHAVPAKEKVNLRGAKQTLLYTLYGRALDFRSERPILGDRFAPQILAKIDYRKWVVKWAAGDRWLIVLRAKRMDGWAQKFLDEHPDATVLALGCGLDSRAFRLNVPATVRWFDVDFPEVVELRRKLYPEREGYQTIASSVTDDEWLDTIPTDKPVLVICEGLIMYLGKTEAYRLLQRLVDRFDEGTFVFDIMSTSIAKLAILGRLRMWGLDDPHEIERRYPRLTLEDDYSPIADYEKIPLRRYRVAYRVLSRIGQLRNTIRPLKFRLSPRR